MTVPYRALAALALLVATGCGPRYVANTEIEYTKEKQEVADIVEQYRVALEARDIDALRALASRDYYENASTTADPTDDYSYEGLVSVLADLKDSIKAVRYEIEIDAIDVMEDVATVDIEYKTQYLFTTGDQDKWATAGDKNRITLKKERDRWRIVSGM